MPRNNAAPKHVAAYFRSYAVFDSLKHWTGVWRAWRLDAAQQLNRSPSVKAHTMRISSFNIPYTMGSSWEETKVVYDVLG